MINKSESGFSRYIDLDGMNPVLLGTICGIYPFLFYVSNNFFASNSLEHWGFFTLVFIGLPILLFTLLGFIISRFSRLQAYKKHLLFVSIIIITGFFLSYASSLLIKKKILLVVLIVSILLSIKLNDRYKKLLVLIVILSVLPFLKTSYKLYEHLSHKEWLEQPDDIESVQFTKTPNVYMIQPDGYVGRSMMEGPLYNYKSDLYEYLEDEGFKVYDDFRSNYPASLNSNSSLFAMRQHQFGSSLMPDFEMPDAREVISGNNPVHSIFKKNNYKTFFVAEDEYFQQNKCDQLYDYFNIDIDDVAYFSKGESVTRKVLPDVKEAFEHRTDKPSFFFIEKCLPHHVHFYAEGDRVAKERIEYLEKIEEVNIWLKETIDFITSQDPDGIIIVLADHGGWVGMNNYKEMFSTKSPEHINSIYSNLAAIKWNGFNEEGYDEKLRTNVNMFRVLFAALSENKSYLNFMEDNSSYNLHLEKSFFNGVSKVMDDSGEVIYEKQ
tara:strand:+ start:53544 stop:55025 length:1482 start_codon:yes stop_codon:yes gene_type:complete